MKIPKKIDIEKYLHEFNPAGLKNARVEKNLTPKNANNHFNWVITKNKKGYVMRIAKPKGNLTTDITIEYLMLRHLENTGLAPQSYWIDPLGFTYPLLIEDFVNGKALNCKPNFSELRSVARSIARLHQLKIPTNIPLVGRNYELRFETLNKRLKGAMTKPLVKKAVEENDFLRLMTKIKNFFRFATAFSDNHPRVLLHGDLYPGNILIKKDGAAAFVDFQTPAVGDPTFDFGNIFVDINWRAYYDEFKNEFLAEYLRHHSYPKLAELFTVRMIERDITSVISEFRDAAAKLPQNKYSIEKYFKQKRLQWRTQLIQKALGQIKI